MHFTGGDYSTAMLSFLALKIKSALTIGLIFILRNRNPRLQNRKPLATALKSSRDITTRMKRWTLPVIVLAVALVGSAGYLGSRQANGADPGTVQARATVAVARGDVQQVVSAPGHLVGTRQVTLAMQASGVLAEIKARPGERVQKGAGLARLDTAGLELQLQKAEAGLKIAQDQLAQVKNPGTDQDVATARAKLEAAQAAYDKLKAGPSATDLAAAQAAVAGAQAAYDAAVKAASSSSSQFEAAAAAVQKAQVAVQQAQAAYDRVKGAPNIGMLPQSTALQQATIDYQQAQANYQALQATADANANSAVQQARSQLEQAQAGLARLQAPASAADLAAARLQVTQAGNDLEKLLAGPEANALDIAQNNVTQAEIAVKQAQQQFAQAQVTAPFDGVVTEVRANAGDSIAAGAPLIVLTDPAALEVVGTVVEEDLSQVQAGQSVDLFFDAQPDVAAKGHVARIVPELDTTADRTAYPVAITLDQPVAGLMPGMSVDASIIIAQKSNVLRLPRSIVRAGADGKAVVQVWQGDHAEQRTVTVGLRGDVNVEIVNGLREGDQVVGQ